MSVWVVGLWWGQLRVCQVYKLVRCVVLCYAAPGLCVLCCVTLHLDVYDAATRCPEGAARVCRFEAFFSVVLLGDRQPQPNMNSDVNKSSCGFRQLPGTDSPVCGGLVQHRKFPFVTSNSGLTSSLLSTMVFLR